MPNLSLAPFFIAIFYLLAPIVDPLLTLIFDIAMSFLILLPISLVVLENESPFFYPDLMGEVIMPVLVRFYGVFSSSSSTGGNLIVDHFFSFLGAYFAEGVYG